MIFARKRMIDFKYWGKRPRASGGGSPLRCGPEPVVSVDHGGKLFERINGNELPVAINGIIQTNPGIPFYQRVFAHATESIGSGMTAAQGRVSFVTFLCPAKKSKRKNVD